MNQLERKDLSVYELIDAWRIPFFNRERIPEPCDLFDNVNGVYPNDDMWDSTDIILHLRASVDENGRVNDITYYKVKDMMTGHGRPVTKYYNLTASDIKRFTEILDTYTVPRACNVIEPLLLAAKQTELPDGWMISRITKTTVVFYRDNKALSIPKKQIIKALEVSYTYLEILSNPDYWDANTRFLKAEYKDPLLALFSLVDTSQYYHRDQLIEVANKRAHAV